MGRDRVVDQILADYEQLEPAQTDSWNPVGSKFQLGYRLNLFYALATALQHVPHPLADLRVLDLGCGNGRSTRMYLDMGLQPQQLRGVDLRPGAIALARKLSPAIQWDVHDEGDLPRGHNWLSTTTVFSSVATREGRLSVVARIRDSLPRDGYVFYYDARRANPVAGNDLIEPLGLFGGFHVVWSRRLGRFSGMPLRERIRDLVASGLMGNARAASLKELVGDAVAPSQEVLLLRRI